MPNTRHAQLVAWLEDQNHSEAEINQILAKLQEYDDRTVHESVFDSIDAGSIDLVEIIREAIGEQPDDQAPQG